MASRRILPKQFFAMAKPRGALIVILVSLVFVFLERNNGNILKSVRGTIHSLSLPIVQTAYSPFQYMGAIVTDAQSLVGLRSVLAELQRNYQEALAWKVRSQQLLAENHFLRQQLNYKPAGMLDFITGRVIFTTGHPHQRSMIINVGTSHGVAKNDPVVAGGVVVGRIIETDKNSSRVLLIHDSSLRIPVITKESQIQGIVVGYSLSELKLMHVINPDKIKIGEAIYTTGRGGLYAANLYVGKVSRIHANVIYVMSGIRVDDIDFVFVLKQQTGSESDTKDMASGIETVPQQEVSHAHT